MARIPVTVLTGFLGAGKTTILSNLLKTKQDHRFAIIVNEFGEVGIDGALFDTVADNVIELPGGALCCAALGDTTQALARLLEVPQGIDRVIIETTGLADPLPLMKAFFNRPALEKHYQLDAIVTVIDESTALSRTSHPEFQAQIIAANLILLNKGGLLPAGDEGETMGEILTIIHRLNREAEIFSAGNHGELPPAALEAIFTHSFAENITSKVKSLSSPHAHSTGINSVYLKVKEPLSLEKISRFIGEHLVLNGDRLLRYKGIFNIDGHAERFVFQGLGYTFENMPDRPWRPDEERESALILIGTNLTKAEFSEAFENCREN